MPANKLACGKNDKCRDDKCVVKCDAIVDVDLNAEAHARCHQADKNDTNFQLALVTEVNPVCEITPLCVKQSSSDPCKHVCLFNVAVDFDCHASIKQEKCGKPSKRVFVDVDIETSPDCRIVDVCHGKQRPGQDRKKWDDKKNANADKKQSDKKHEKASPVEKKAQAEKKVVAPAEKSSPKSFSNRQYIQALSKEEKTNKSSSQLRFH